MADKDTTTPLFRRAPSRSGPGQRMEQRELDLTEINEALQTVIAERNRANEEIRLLLAVLQAVHGAKDLESAVSSTLRKVSELTGWDYAEAWMAKPDEPALALGPVWHKDHPKLEAFAALSRGFSMKPGAGLAGRVRISRQPEWIQDVTAATGDFFCRSAIAADCGLKAALAVPIPAGGGTIAVFIFLAMESRPRNKRLTDIVSAMATQLGSAIRHKQTEETLHKQEAVLRAIVDNSTRLIYLKDRDGKYLTVNRRYKELFHVTRKGIIGKTDRDVFPEEFAAVFRANDLRVLEAGAAMEFEETFPQDDGAHTYLSNKYPMVDSAGAAYAVCSVSADITGQKRQQENLRAARDLLGEEVRKRTAELERANQALLASVREGERTLERLQEEKDFSQSLINTAQVIVLLLDTDGQIVHFNPYFEKITGYSIAEVKDKDWFTTFLPERDRQGIRALFQKALNGACTRGNVNSILTKDEGERDIEWFDAVLRNAAGDTLGLLCIGQDITERKKAEGWLQGMVSATQDALVSIDRRGRIVMFNPAAERIFGYAADRMIGRRVNELMAEPYAAEHDGYIARYEKTGEARAIGRIRTVEGRRAGGETFPIELSVTEIATEGEVRYAAFIRDISEKVELQGQLVESERLATIGTTAAKIGHELANPLNGMFLAVQLMEQRLTRPQPAPAEQILATVMKIKGEIVRLNQLLQDFRSLSRRERYHFQATKLDALVAEVMEMEGPTCAALGIELENSIPPDLPPVPVDRDKMKQALLNLCSNAAEAMPTGGKVTLRGSCDENSVVLEVADTGIGISPGIDVFEPFTTSKSQGTGLGLVIVRRIVAVHGGTIDYDSAPGQGAVFRVTLPRQGNPQSNPVRFE